VEPEQQLEPPEIPAPEAETPGAQIQEGEAIELVVTAEREAESYRVPTATTGTRTDTPLRDIPASIQVVPQQVIEDQQVVRIEEALGNVSGVTYLGTNDNRGVSFSLRGFENTPTLRDGFRLYNPFFQAFPEVANLERIEVLKGPASILYGELQPGGVINLVSKQPLSNPFYEAELQVGNREFVQPRFDLSGPLTSDGNLLYRFNGLYQHARSFRDYDTDIQRFSVAPALTWKISDRTDLRVSLEYINDRGPADFGTLASGNGIANIPPERVTNQPDDTITNDYLNVGYNFEHRFNDNWKLQNAFRHISFKYNYSVLALPFTFDDATGILTRFFADQESEEKYYALQTNAVGKFTTRFAEHTLLLGVDLSRSEDRSETLFDTLTPLPLDIFNPDYDLISKPNRTTLPVFQDEFQTADRLGIYLQDQISLSENLILLAGLRYDTVSQTTIDNLSPGDEQTQRNDAFTPRVGLVYQPIEEVSLYGSYSQSFNPNQGTTVSGGSLEPERGEGYEIGVKADLLGEKLFATLAYFDITKQNVATEDPNFPGLGFSIATGEQRSQGVELDVTGEILPGWNVIASYAYIDAGVTADTNLDLVGSRLPGIPTHSAGLWTTYEIQRGNLQGLGFGLGFNFVGAREGGLPNSFEVDSYFISNAAIFYRRDNWRFALNLKNLTNADYIEAVGNDRVRGIYPGEPFTVLGSVSVQF